ncbi:MULTISPECIES: lactonase family protein [Thermomonosporaceae]|uniref:lactonase family protein n=1 Tax=Thermomonosporaceae TaxID=2012 RepID=UPI00255AA3D7|nr:MULTISPECIES: lactonase family protein [Thermomonosporaceae]MDL4776518.1 lactonase family protein [Actinomadura xylanilytica]
MEERHFWVGTYTGAMGGGQGVYRLRRGPDGALERPEPAAVTTSPSYLAVHPGGGVLYAVNERAEGAVVAYAVDGGRGLREIGVRPVPAGPCHLTVTPGGGLLLAASYDAGAVSAVRLGPDGAFTGDPSVYQGHGRGPRADRQEGPHAHATAVAPDGTVLAADLGADVVRAYRIAADGGALEPVSEIRLPAGCGPRHLVVHPGGPVHVLTELAGTVITLRPGSGHADLRITAEAPATAGPVPAGSQSAAIKLGADGRHLYTSMRGADVVTTHRILPGGAGTEPVDDVPSGGEWPRDLHVDGEWLHVANQYSGLVAAFRIGADGVPVPAGPPVEVPSPACIVPA